MISQHLGEIHNSTEKGNLVAEQNCVCKEKPIQKLLHNYESTKTYQIARFPKQNSETEFGPKVDITQVKKTVDTQTKHN